MSINTSDPTELPSFLPGEAITLCRGVIPGIEVEVTDSIILITGEGIVLTAKGYAIHPLTSAGIVRTGKINQLEAHEISMFAVELLYAMYDKGSQVLPSLDKALGLGLRL